MRPQLRCFSSARSFGDIGFVGLGNMGGRMALNLAKHQVANQTGRRVMVYDKYPKSEVLRSIEEAGGVVCNSVEETRMLECDTFISMLPSSPHVQELYFKYLIPNLANVSREITLIDSSTIDPKVSLSIHQAVKGASSYLTMLDAPVSGGIKGAEKGTLTFMVGTSLSENNFNQSQRISSTLAPMGKAVYCGGPSMGQSVKVCNNLILGAQMLGVAEGYRLAETLGVDLKKFHAIVNSSTGKSWTTEKYVPVPGLMEDVPANRGYQGGFMADLMVKDLGLAVNSLVSSDSRKASPLPVAEFCKSEYEKIGISGKGNLDFGYYFELYKHGGK